MTLIFNKTCFKQFSYLKLEITNNYNIQEIHVNMIAMNNELIKPGHSMFPPVLHASNFMSHYSCAVQE